MFTRSEPTATLQKPYLAKAPFRVQLRENLHVYRKGSGLRFYLGSGTRESHLKFGLQGSGRI